MHLKTLQEWIHRLHCASRGFQGITKFKNPCHGIFWVITRTWTFIPTGRGNHWRVNGDVTWDDICLKIRLISELRVFCCCCLVAKSCPTLCDPRVYSMPGFPVLHYILEFAQIHVHWVSNATQPSRSLLSHSPSAFNLSQHQSHFQWVNSLHQVAKVLELQLQQ